MLRVKHLFHQHKIHPFTEILVIGTFNPDTPENYADFFYGRRQNYLWKLLPLAFGESDLKNARRSEKESFMRRNRIDFLDLIEEVYVEDGMEANYNDDYLDERVAGWKDAIGEMNKLDQLRKACFTRKTFSGIPNINKRIKGIEKYCLSRGVEFNCLVTPSRGYSKKKQEEWRNFFVKK